MLGQTLPLAIDGRASGADYDARTGQRMAFHRTPGYQTYAGLG